MQKEQNKMPNQKKFAGHPIGFSIKYLQVRHKPEEKRLD